MIVFTDYGFPTSWLDSWCLRWLHREQESMLAMYGAVKWSGILRVDEIIEVYGMDLIHHNDPAYSVESWKEKQYWDHQVNKLFNAQ